MLKYLSVSVLIACFFATGLSAQTAAIPIGDAMVGVPFSFDFGQGFSELASIFNSAGIEITFTYSFSSSGGLPPGITLSPSGLLSGTPTTPGTFDFSFTLTFNYTETIDGMTFSDGGTFPYPELSLNVTGNSVAATVNPPALSFALTEGSTSAVSQSVVVANSGNSAATFTASAVTETGGSWLSISPGSGTVAPYSTGSISVNVDPSKLSAGTYLGNITVSVSSVSQPFEIAVAVTVSGGEAQLQISQSGLFYQAQAGGGQPSSQSITVLNGGSGSLNFSASSSTTSGGSKWLSVSPSSGAVTSTASANVVVNINPAGLQAGDYYGQVQFTASGAANSPQTASVVLHVAPTGANLESVAPSGLIFVGDAGAATIPSQTLSVTNPTTATLTYIATPFFTQGNNWFTVSPASGTVSAGTPIQITVQPVLTGLASGVYSGEVVVQFVEDSSTRHIAVLLVVVPGGAVSKTSEHVAHAAGCTPTKLFPVFTQLGANFATVAAWPTPVAVTIVDDCGNFMTSGSVTASFSDGDPSLPLTSLNNGNWSATWQPLNTSSQVVITVDAAQLFPPLDGTQSIGGALQSNPTTPSIGGVGSPAKAVVSQP